MNLKNCFAAVVVTAALVVPAFALAKHSKTNADKGGSAKFSVQLSPAAMGKIEGSAPNGSAITVEEKGSKTIISVSLRHIETGIDLRNKHFQKMLGDKGKDLVLSVETAQIVKDGSQKTINADVTANGKTTKGVPVSYKAKKEGDKVNVSGSLTIQYTDFYESQKYLSVGANAPVKITAEFTVDDK